MHVRGGKLHRLDLQMQPIQIVRTHPADVEAPQYTQRHQGRDALSVGRYLVQRDIADFLRDGAAPVVGMGREIALVQGRAMLFGKSRNRFRQRTAVERLSAALGDRLEGAGEIGIAKDFAGLWGAAIRHKSFLEARFSMQLQRSAAPLLGDNRRHVKAAFSIIDCRGEEICEWQAPKSARERSTHAETAPGTVTDSQPRCGMAARPAKRSGVQSADERPEAFNPWSSLPSQRMQKASEPSPFPVGSTTTSAIAAANAASMALPPRTNIRRPACVASGWEVVTTFRPKTGERRDG